MKQATCKICSRTLVEGKCIAKDCPPKATRKHQIYNERRLDQVLNNCWASKDYSKKAS